jgi:hypothetical protein
MYPAFGKEGTVLLVVQTSKLNTLIYRKLHIRNIPALYSYHDGRVK